jgi:hypothetical protein
MTTLLRRIRAIHGFRATGVALAALALSVGVAFAANPHGSPPGQSGAHGHQGPASSEGADASEAPEAPEATDAPDENGTSSDAHGALVSAAAQMTTPAGFRNHGAFVSCVAHMKDATLATIDWSTVTPSSCAAAAPGNSDH